MNARIDTMLFLYGCTICDNIENAPKMSAKVQAILDHTVVPKKNHITMTVLRVLKTAAATNVIKVLATSTYAPPKNILSKL